ncbi:hypothetical protein [Desulfovibrio ferrophilus]|uniref:Uncharacterized protein n=1 Tax=Desulfovibrio ferrophilus TaxID=241368 RepID=A0A2Z6AX25_9BACT|nr:hypothetical protein [Desulfovibrio ferrophilus]BBD07770.1 uncharacterized protein DFE_1044 [Desulfovibrio ferrophilus]
MSEYKQSDIPCKICHGEFLKFDDGKTVRFESNGEAKDVFFGDEWTATVQLFPANEYEFESSGKKVKLTALFEDGLQIEYA